MTDPAEQVALTEAERTALLCDCGGVTPPDKHEDCALNEESGWLSLSTASVQERTESILAARLSSLLRWKAEATQVIAEWERIHDALGSPAKLGESRAAASLAALAAAARLAPSGTEAASGVEDFRIRQLRGLLEEWGKPPGRMLKQFLAEVAAILGPEAEECAHPWHRGAKEFCPVHVPAPAPLPVPDLAERLRALADEWDRPGMVGISDRLRALLAPTDGGGEQ